jgi:hypothetical protein
VHHQQQQVELVFHSPWQSFFNTRPWQSKREREEKNKFRWGKLLHSSLKNFSKQKFNNI